MATEKKYKVSLDMKRSITERRPWTVVEGDTGNIIEIELTDDGEPVDLTGCRVLAVFGKPAEVGLPNGQTVEQDTDGNGVTVGGDDNNIITIELYASSFSPGMSSVGNNSCEIQVYSGDDYETLVTSAQFSFKCRRSIMNPDTVQAEPAYPIMITATAAANSAAAAANAAAASASAAAGDANAAADFAGEKATLANTAASNANTKAGIADEKATLADQKATLADQKATAANDAAAAANEAAEDANAAAEAANSAAAAALLNAQSDWSETDDSKGTFIKNKPSIPSAPSDIGAAASDHTHTPAAIGAEAQRLQFTNITVATTAFVADTTYEDFGYRAAVALTGVTASMTPEVVLGVTEAMSGNFAPVAECYAGGVYIYAAEVPDASITVPTIICWKAVS